MPPTDFKTGLTQARLKSLLHYEPETGVFTALVTRGNVRAGSALGTNHCGYRLIRIDRRGYTASRLAWLYMTGEWPADLIDHADTIKTNNAWTNLRSASHADNMRNRSAFRNRAPRMKGVHLKKDALRMRPWGATIRVNGALKHLGYFSHPEEAHAAYAKAAEANFGSFARA